MKIKKMKISSFIIITYYKNIAIYRYIYRTSINNYIHQKKALLDLKEIIKNHNLAIKYKSVIYFI